MALPLLLILLTVAAYVHRYQVLRAIDRIAILFMESKQDNSGTTVVSPPEGYTVHGIDVSHYQGDIDWQAVGRVRFGEDSIAFAFIKATEGRRIRDRKFNRNWKGARAAGMIRGAYHYYVPHVNSRVQAENFMRNVRLKPGDLAPVVDIEAESIYGSDNMRRGLLNFLTIIERHYGIKPIIYTSASFYSDHLNRSEFEKFPLWVAHYRPRKPRIHSQRWEFWQYSDNGRIEGCSHKIDLNVFKGEKHDLNGFRLK